MGPNPARTIGGYELHRRTRTGPHLAVFESLDNLGRRIEISCYQASTLRDRTGNEAFLEEARRTASLHHENLCPTIDAGEEGDVWYAVSVAPNAPSLAELLERGGALAADRVRHIAEGVTAGLAHLSGEGLRHGDIRPETVYLASGRVLLAPRRMVPLAPGERDARYLAPEEIRAEGTDIRADLFSLGVILAEALVGKPPFAGESPEEVLLAIDAGPPALPADAPAELAGLVLALLASHPEDRPSDPAVIGRVLSGEIVLAAPPPAGETASAPREPLPATPSPVATPFATQRRDIGALEVPMSGGDPAAWEIVDERTYLSLSEEGMPVVSLEESEAAVARIDRGAEGDVLSALPDREPRCRVNGSLVDRHVLSPGDLILLGEAKILYGPAPEVKRRAAGASRRGKGRSALKPLATLGACLLVLAFAGLQAKRILSSGEEVVRAAAEAEERLANRGSSGGDFSPITPEFRNNAKKAYGKAMDFAKANPLAFDAIRDRLMTVRRLYGPTTYGHLAAKEIEQNETRRREHLAIAFDELAQSAGALIEEDRLHDAFLLYQEFEAKFADTLFGDRAEREATNIEAAIESRFEEDRARAEAAMRAQDYGLALDILSTAARYGSPSVRDQAESRIDKIRRLIQETQVPDGEPADPVLPPDTPPKPPGPGPGPGPADPPAAPPAGPLESRAEAIHNDAVKAFERKRWAQVLELIDKLRLPPLNGSSYVADRVDQIGRLAGLARLERDGFAALFNGQVKVIKGRQVVLTYGFDSAEEERDWTFINPFADPGTGYHERKASDMALRGVGALVHSAVFEPKTLIMRAHVQAMKPQDFGLQFFEPKEMLRFYLFTVQNRYFTIGAERKSLHENVIWVFGGGAWADTPTGDIGFIRVGKSRTPAVTAGEWIDIEAAKVGPKLTWKIKGTPPLTGNARGDDGFEYPALQPALYVLRSDTVFGEVEIRGTLDKAWVDKALARARKKLQAD